MSKEARLLLERSGNRRASSVGVWALIGTATFLFGATANALAATYRTPNFIVNADSSDFARKADRKSVV